MFKFNEKLGESRGPAGGDENGKPLKKYVPIEEVAEEIPEPLDNKNEEPENNEEAEQDPYEAFVEDLKNEEENEKIMNQKVGFVEIEKEGVAHIGPEFVDLERNENYSPKLEFKKGEKLSLKQIDNTNEEPTRESKASHLSKLPYVEVVNKEGDEFTLGRVLWPKTKKERSGVGHDNLKTIKKTKDKFGEPSKLQRMLRKTIGKFYDNQKEDDRPSWEDVLEDQKN